MSNLNNVKHRAESIRDRYENYLRTYFYFKDKNLRESFNFALQGYKLLKGPFPETTHDFQRGIVSARDLAKEFFPNKSNDLEPALLDQMLYKHQESAIRVAHKRQENIVVATGTASGKTECFLYPILFDLYQQHLNGDLQDPGVRALILYPMNALANDQRRRLGGICKQLKDNGSAFEPSFGQYIGQTPENKQDRYRNGSARNDDRLPGEMVFREEMRANPPHIMLTNYSMLEYLLVRPLDSPLFDDNRSRYWKFIVLDEAHQYRGTRGMEMGMLVSRLKQRLRDGGRQGSYQCVATSATIASGESEENKQTVAKFAENLFGEQFSSQNIIFGEHESLDGQGPSRHHAFIRALEGAFLIHEEKEDKVILNRQQKDEYTKPLEIALCRECGQHYYIGQESNGYLDEAMRDLGNRNFGVEYYLPSTDANLFLCRKCSRLSNSSPDCGHRAAIRVKKCEADNDYPDQIKKCEACGYRRGSVGDPVHEIVHGSDDPNAVIATTLHQLLPDTSRKVLAFADSRQDAAFFAWYIEDSYRRLRDRNLMLKAMKQYPIDDEGLSIDDLQNRLRKEWNSANMFDEFVSSESQKRQILESILKEALTDETRLSLAGVGLIKWFVKIPGSIRLPQSIQEPPWNLTDDEARRLLGYLLDYLRMRRALSLPKESYTPPWKDIYPYSQQAFSKHKPQNQRNVSEWGGEQSDVVKYFLKRLLGADVLSEKEKSQSVKLMKQMWETVREYDEDQPEEKKIFTRASKNGEFRLNSGWLRVKLAKQDDVYRCDTCARLSIHNIRGICPRGKCSGTLEHAIQKRLDENYYRKMYQDEDLPAKLRAEEHTAQIESDKAREIQEEFKKGHIHLLSSSTTFEMGVDLGDLEVAFLRNVPPEPFNYIQRAGRVGRREDTPGLVLTYCRRNPHDLYHFENPEKSIITSSVHPPRLRMTNKKIILRHMVAVAFSSFFKHGQNGERFTNVEALVGDFKKPRAVSDLKAFCRNDLLKNSLCMIVPKNMHNQVGLDDDSWINDVAGPDSRFADAEKEVCHDYTLICDSIDEISNMRPVNPYKIAQLHKRANAITSEPTLNFLSRKAIIPKYGFPVDVVELDTHSLDEKVSLQRNLSQAIAEYAPGCKVVANKREWESCGVKTIPDKQFPVKYYTYTSALDFKQQEENDDSNQHKYLEPTFGFVTRYYEQPKEPRRRARRIYTTRPFFPGFTNEPDENTLLGIQVTESQPGNLVILCEGWRKRGFYICRTCGKYEVKRKPSHCTPNESKCHGALEEFSLGHELVTDVVRLQFPQVNSEEDAYSLGYAILLGAADVLNVPDTDLNTTIAKGASGNKAAIILYDNVPGGAGLVAQLNERDVFQKMLSKARERMSGGCGCSSSCYGCLRSYRNQFAHQYLKRTRALQFLNDVLD